MATAIIYASKYGCAADCAAYLQNHLAGGVTLMDINASQAIDLGKFDKVIIGGSVYAGAVAKKLRVFCEQNIDALVQKKVGLFLCCASAAEAQKYFVGNFPVKLVSSAVITETFGGEARVDKMGFFFKLILRIAMKGDYSSLQIAYDNMERFAESFNV